MCLPELKPPEELMIITELLELVLKPLTLIYHAWVASKQFILNPISDSKMQPSELITGKYYKCELNASNEALMFSNYISWISSVLNKILLWQKKNFWKNVK